MFISKGRFGIKLAPLGKIPADILDFLTEEARKKTMYMHVSKLIGKETPI